MKTLIVYKSCHHLNTERIAAAIAKAMSARLAKVGDVTPESLADYDLVGFGSGIYHGKHHKALLDFARKLPPQGRAAFIFSTCGSGKNQHGKLRDILVQKGFTIKGEFTCAAFDTRGPFGLVGGISKGHPDFRDFEHAGAFAMELLRGR